MNLYNIVKFVGSMDDYPYPISIGNDDGQVVELDETVDGDQIANVVFDKTNCWCYIEDLEIII